MKGFDSTKILGFVVWACGPFACATAPTQQPPPSAPSAPSASEARMEAGPQVPAQRISSPTALLSLCEALKDSDAVSVTGSADEQERARQAHEVRRAEAFESAFVVDLVASGFNFTGYDQNQAVLQLSDRSFALDEGAVVDRPTAEDPIGFALGEAAAKKLLQMHAEGSISLRLVFQPQPSQMRPDACLWQTGGRSLKLGAQVLAAYILGNNGAVMARFETDGWQQVMANTTPVNDPTVVVGKPLSADAVAVPIAWEQAALKLREPLLACYQATLARNNAIQGTLVVSVALGRDGRAQIPRMEMSTISDQTLIDCSLEVVGKVGWGASVGASPAGLSLPVTFGSAP